MRYTHMLYLGVSLSLCSCNSCKTATSPHLTIAYLSEYQWHLISVTNTNPSVPTYKGTLADSMRFTWKWAYNGNVIMDSAFNYRNGLVNKDAGNFEFGPPANGSYLDTILLNNPWKASYTNALVIRSIAGNYLVFTVNSSNGLNVETDSLHY